jgi:hypothetical protein
MACIKVLGKYGYINLLQLMDWEHTHEMFFPQLTKQHCNNIALGQCTILTQEWSENLQVQSVHLLVTGVAGGHTRV